MKKNYVIPELFCDEYVPDTVIAASSCNSSPTYVNGQGCDEGNPCAYSDGNLVSTAWSCSNPQ